MIKGCSYSIGSQSMKKMTPKKKIMSGKDLPKIGMAMLKMSKKRK